ncbi:hypothetical protein D3C76_805140 [compost metagenome]
MVDQVALGLACGTGGEVEVIRVGFFDVDLRFVRRRALKQRLVVTAQCPALAEADVMGHVWQVVQKWQQWFAETALQYKCHDACSAHQFEHLHGCKAVVQRQADQTSLCQGEVDLDHLCAVAAQKSHPVALAQAQITKAVGQAIASLVGLAESEAAIGGGAYEGFPLGETYCSSTENLTYHHFSHGTTCHRTSPAIAWCRTITAETRVLFLLFAQPWAQRRYELQRHVRMGRYQNRGIGGRVREEFAHLWLRAKTSCFAGAYCLSRKMSRFWLINSVRALRCRLEIPQ